RSSGWRSRCGAAPVTGAPRPTTCARRSGARGRDSCDCTSPDPARGLRGGSAARRLRQEGRSRSPTGQGKRVPEAVPAMNHFAYRNGVLFAEEVAVPDIAARVGTPFYCYSTATLRRHYQVFAGALSDMGVRVCYAVKANSNLAVIRTLAALGAGADVVSEGELRRALAAGVAPRDIVFSGV